MMFTDVRLTKTNDLINITILKAQVREDDKIVDLLKCNKATALKLRDKLNEALKE